MKITTMKFLNEFEGFMIINIEGTKNQPVFPINEIKDSNHLKKKIKEWIKQQEQEKALQTQRLNKFEVLKKELEGEEL